VQHTWHFSEMWLLSNFRFILLTFYIRDELSGQYRESHKMRFQGLQFSIFNVMAIESQRVRKANHVAPRYCGLHHNAFQKILQLFPGHDTRLQLRIVSLVRRSVGLVRYNRTQTTKYVCTL
jgi:hypothetical protein